MLEKGISLFLVACMTASSTSCATIISGRTQDVPVVTQPSGAIVTVGQMKQTSPATFALDRRQSVYVVKVEHEGYESVEIVLKKGMNGWVWGNLVFGGIIGLIVDISTGSASKFTPDEVEVNLVEKQLGLKNLEGKDILFVKLADK